MSKVDQSLWWQNGRVYNLSRWFRDGRVILLQSNQYLVKCAQKVLFVRIINHQTSTAGRAKFNISQVANIATVIADEPGFIMRSLLGLSDIRQIDFGIVHVKIGIVEAHSANGI